MLDTSSSVPHAWLENCRAAHQRLLTVVEHMTDEMARQPSLLPDWSVGHLLTHLARNADSVTDMTYAAQRGMVAAQYPGGRAQRDDDIAAGAGDPAAALIEDLHAAQRRLEQAWATTGEEVWSTGLGSTAGGRRTIAECVFRRWREVEVHLVDLGLTALGSPDWEGLSAPYVDVEWAELTGQLPHRLATGVSVVLVPGDRPSRAFGSGEAPVVVRATTGRILCWLFGRGGDPAWPALGPWS